MKIDRHEHFEDDVYELRCLKGIALLGLPENPEDGTEVAVALRCSYDAHQPDFWEGEPGLRILPAEEPLPTLARWNKKCEEWLPVIRKIDRAAFWGIYFGTVLMALAWMVGKGMGKW